MNMKNANLSKSLVLCLFGLLALTGCKKKYPSVYEYTGVWDFCVHLYPGQYDSNYYYTPMPDTIINYTGRIAYEGGGLLLIEFNQNECMEAKYGMRIITMIIIVNNRVVRLESLLAPIILICHFQ